MRKPRFFNCFSRFFKVWENCAGTCFATGSGGPKVRHGTQLGGRNPPKVPILEAPSAPKTAIWRSRALQRPQLGGPEPFREPKLEAPSAPRTQLGVPSAEKSFTWSSKALPSPQFGGPKRSETSIWRLNALPRCRPKHSRNRTFR